MLTDFPTGVGKHPSIMYFTPNGVFIVSVIVPSQAICNKPFLSKSALLALKPNERRILP